MVLLGAGAGMLEPYKGTVFELNTVVLFVPFFVMHSAKF